MRISLILGILMGSGCTSTSSDTADATLGNPIEGAGTLRRDLHPASFLRKVHCGYRMIPCCSVTSQPIGFTAGMEPRLRFSRAPSGVSNGLILDASDRLLAAEHQNRRISRTEEDGTLTTVVDAYEGISLNSPNDLVLRQSGHLYFSDPPYGINETQQELPHNGVYVLAPDGVLSLIWSGAVDTRPNGVGLSPDERTLYVSFTREGVVRAFELGEDGLPVSDAVFATTGESPDGMTVDEQGNVYVASKAGIQVFSSEGMLWGYAGCTAATYELHAGRRHLVHYSAPFCVCMRLPCPSLRVL